MEYTFGGKSELITTISKKLGTDIKISVKRISNISIFPPIYPLIVPINVPIVVDKSIDKNPTEREILPPYNARVK